MKPLFSAVFLASIVVIAGCSSGSSGQSGTGTVLAQSGYTNASLTGTYAYSLVAPYNGSGPFDDQVGTITFDGSGHITGGSATAYLAATSSPASCSLTNFTGTYSVQTSGAGTATLTDTVSGTGCSGGATALTVTLEVAGGGRTIEFGSAVGSTQVFAGSAAKQ